MLRRCLLWYAAAALLLSGCMAAPGLRPAPAAPQVAAAPVRLHLPVEPTALDPAETADAALLDVVGNLMEGLVVEEEGALTGGAAERWESVDGRQFTFYLRPEARWSDGRPVTAADFVHAWLHLLDPAVGAENAYLLYDVAGAEEWNALDPAAPDFVDRTAELRGAVQVAALDAQRLQVTLREPNPGWVAYTAHAALAPRRADRPFGEVSNGPFALAEGPAAGGEIRLEPNPFYWDAESVRLPSVTYHVERDGQAALRLYEMGYLHLAVLPADLAAGVQGVTAMAQPATMGLVFNTSQPRLANPDLRRAICLALDRRQLAYEAAGQGGVAAAGLVPPSLAGGWQSGGGPAPVQGDPVAARRLWESVRKQLGVDQITLRLLHAGEATALARSVQRALQAALEGLVVELHTVPFDQRLERVRFGQFDLVLQGWVAEHDDPLALLGLFTTAHPGNAARWVNAEYDRLIAEAAGATGEARRSALAAAERLLLDEAPVVPLYHPVRHWAVRPELQGLRYRPLGARFDLKRADIAPAESQGQTSERESRAPGRIG